MWTASLCYFRFELWSLMAASSTLLALSWAMGRFDILSGSMFACDSSGSLFLNAQFIHKVTKTAVLEDHLEGFDCFPHGLLEQCNIWLWCDNGWFDGFHSVFECLIGDETWFIFGWGCHGEIGAAGDGTIVVAGVLTVVAAGVVHLFHCYGSCLQLGCQTNCWMCVGSWCLWLQLVVFLGSSWVLTTALCDVCQSVWLHQIQQIQRPNAWWSLMNANNQLHRLLSSTGGIPTLCFAQPEHPRGGWTTLEPRLHGWITDLDGIPLAAKAVFIERLCTGLNCCQLTVGDLGDDWCWMMRSVVCRWHNPHCNTVWLWRVNFRCFIRIWLMIIDLWACSPCSIVRTNESTVETFVGLWGFLTDNLLFKFEFVFLFHKKVQLQFQMILHAADPDFAQK